MCGGKLFSTDGTMQENYTGVADISVVDGKIKKISSKPDILTGKMLSYNEGQMNIEGTGQMPMVSKQIPVYDASGENVQEIAEQLLISRAALYRHITSINEKTNTKSRIGLVQFYYRFEGGIPHEKDT